MRPEVRREDNAFIVAKDTKLKGTIDIFLSMLSEAVIPHKDGTAYVMRDEIVPHVTAILNERYWNKIRHDAVLEQGDD